MISSNEYCNEEFENLYLDMLNHLIGCSTSTNADDKKLQAASEHMVEFLDAHTKFQELPEIVTQMQLCGYFTNAKKAAKSDKAKKAAKQKRGKATRLA
jgi:hypothetical protein